MCGIVGFVRNPGSAPIALDDLRRMADAIVHRGPDDAGFFTDDTAAIGMRRLSIIDLAGGHQPITNEDGTLQVVCNGEIYNFQALRQQLVQAGHAFRTGSDVEVLLHLYEEHGRDFLQHVSGMFGLALWDAPRKRLVLARDRLGQKPLYYHVDGARLSFASEVKALLQLPHVQAGIDLAGLQDHLAIGYAVAPRTIFRGIFKLPPASCLVWEPSGWRVERYWELPTATRADLTPAQWTDAIREELRRAVAEHMVSDVPIGAFLSGGVDSSAVVALMGEHTGQPVSTYSIGYSGSATADYYNELPFAAQVARRFATHHHEILVQPDVAALLPTLVWHLEEPISDSAIATTYLVAQLAGETVKVILSGVGGDELFAGYRRYLGPRYSRQFGRLPAWLRAGVLRPIASALPSGRQNRAFDLARYTKRFVQAADLPWQAQYRLYLEIAARGTVAGLMRAPLAPQDGLDRVLGGEHSPDELLRLLRVDAASQLPEDLLLLTDKMTMARSIECRVPFLDHQLVELAARMPSELKLAGGELKHTLRTALQGLLPDEILNRPKRGFGAPVGAWFKKEMRVLREELLGREVIERRGLLDAAAVRRVAADHDAHREDYSDLLLVLMNLEIWCRLFLDGRQAADVGGELAERARAA